MSTTVAYVCPVCRDTDSYFGLLLFPDDEGNVVIPTCPNHRNADGTEDAVLLVPAK